MSSTLQEKETNPLSQVEKQITEHVLLSTSQRHHFLKYKGQGILQS